MPVTGVFIWDMARTAETEPAKKFVACLNCMLHIVYIRHSVIRWAADPGSLNQSSPVPVYFPGAEGEKMAQEGASFGGLRFFGRICATICIFCRKAPSTCGV